MQIGDDEEDSDDPQQVQMVDESGEAYESDEDPVPASNISKNKDPSKSNVSAQMQNLSGQNISANLQQK